MKIWHFGDTHGNHRQLEVPKGVDLAIFSGDSGTYRDAYMSEPLVKDFIDWFYTLDIPHKIYVAGNHDSPIEANLIGKKEMNERNIIYLENEETTINGIKIWGSPLTPTFGHWSFMKARHKLHKYWDLIPDDTDILVTHGPPKGILDVCQGRKGLESAGCTNLYDQVINRIKPMYHFFGHIHNHINGDYRNAGIRMIPNCNTLFSNGSVCADGNMDKIFNNGNTFDYEY